MLAAAPLAHADAAIFENGRILSVEEASWSGDSVTLLLPGGGELTVERRLIDRVIKTPDVPEESPEEAQISAVNFNRQYGALIDHLAKENGVEAGLILAVAKVESNFDTFAVSRAGAAGLMQLMPATARHYGVKDVFDPEQNLSAGVRHLAVLLDVYDGDRELALAAYNAGEKAVKRYGGIPPFRETRNYVRFVLRYMDQFQQPPATGS